MVRVVGKFFEKPSATKTRLAVRRRGKGKAVFIVGVD
jgi:hypothetical protein